ncbi:MAG: hydrolase [Proteobacteria bacterium]|nr:MAG: hydrolase [Pseudomonadota bacterium]
MANFNTHISVAAVASGLISTLCLQVGLVDSKDAMLLMLMGTIGGILPDIDLKYSYPSRIIFSTLGIIVSFLWILSAENVLSISELWVIGIIIYLTVRYGLWKLFNHYTVHRGALHSVIAAFLFMQLTTVISFHFYGRDDFTAWLIGFMVFIGFLIHLLLDELYSVDFMNRRIKRSFGTALKIVDTRHAYSSSLIIALCIGLWFVSPDVSRFADTLTSGETYQLIYSRLLPTNLNFGSSALAN